MATTPGNPRLPDHFEPDTDVVATDDGFADDTTRRAADERDAAPARDAAPVTDDAAGVDDEDVAAESAGSDR